METFIGFTIPGKNNHITVHLSPMMVHLCYQGLSDGRNNSCFSAGFQCEAEREADIVHVSTSPWLEKTTALKDDRSSETNAPGNQLIPQGLLQKIDKMDLKP